MTFRLTDNTVPALVTLTGLILGGSFHAASTFDMAQPDWLHEMEPELTISTASLADSLSVDSYIISNRSSSPESTALQILQASLADRNQSSVLGDGASYIERAIQFQNSSSGTGTSLSSPHSFAAAGVISQMVRADHQDAIAWISSVSDSNARNGALASFIETLSGNPDSGGFPWEIIDADRNRGERRGSRNSDPRSENGYTTTDLLIHATPDVTSVTSIPELSTAFLGVLGGFLLLHRRRIS